VRRFVGFVPDSGFSAVPDMAGLAPIGVASHLLPFSRCWAKLAVSLTATAFT
jgi:hypothetical protein